MTMQCFFFTFFWLSRPIETGVIFGTPILMGQLDGMSRWAI